MTTTSAAVAEVYTITFPTEKSLGLKIFPHRLTYEDSINGTLSSLDCCLVTSSMVSNKIQMGDILINLESTNNGETTTSILVLDNKEIGEDATVHTEISFEENIEVIASTVPPRRVQVFRLLRPVIIDAAMKSVLDEAAAVSSSTMLTDNEMKVLLSAMSNPFSLPSTTIALANNNEENQTTATSITAKSSSAASASLRNWFDSDPAEVPSNTTAQDRSLIHPRTESSDNTHPSDNIHPSDRKAPGTGTIDRGIDTHVKWSESQPATTPTAIAPTATAPTASTPAATAPTATTSSLPHPEKPENELAHPYNEKPTPLTDEKILPAGWKAAIDAVSGLPYYYDSVTMTSQFAFPTTPVKQITSEEIEQEKQKKQGEPEVEVLPDGWLVATEATTGRKYYYNYDLNVSQWEAPVVMGETSVPLAASYVLSEGQDRSLGGGLEDEINGQSSDINTPSQGKGLGLVSGQGQGLANEHNHKQMGETVSKTTTTTAVVSESLLVPTQGQGLAQGPKTATSSSSNNNHSNTNDSKNHSSKNDDSNYPDSNLTNQYRSDAILSPTGGEGGSLDKDREVGIGVGVGMGGIKSSSSSKLAAFLASSSSKKGENSPPRDRGGMTREMGGDGVRASGDTSGGSSSSSGGSGGSVKTMAGVTNTDTTTTASSSGANGSTPSTTTASTTTTTSKLAAFLRSNTSGRVSSIEDLSPTATALVTAAQVRSIKNILNWPLLQDSLSLTSIIHSPTFLLTLTPSFTHPPSPLSLLPPIPSHPPPFRTKLRVALLIPPPTIPFVCLPAPSASQASNKAYTKPLFRYFPPWHSDCNTTN